MPVEVFAFLPYKYLLFPWSRVSSSQFASIICSYTQNQLYSLHTYVFAINLISSMTGYTLSSLTSMAIDSQGGTTNSSPSITVSYHFDWRSHFVLVVHEMSLQLFFRLSLPFFYLVISSSRLLKVTHPVFSPCALLILIFSPLIILLY